MLSKLEEEIQIDDEQYSLSVNKYPDVIHPQGHKHIEQFRLDPFPTTIYSLPSLSIRKKIFVPYGTNGVVINYKILKNESRAASVKIRPLVNSRGIDEITKNKNLGFSQKTKNKRVEIFTSESDNPTMLIGSDLMDYNESDSSESERWYRNMEYLEDKERGYEYREDHYSPGVFELNLGNNNEFNILATGGHGVEDYFSRLFSATPAEYEEIYLQNVRRLKKLTDGFESTFFEENKQCWEHLVRAADSFIVNEKYVMACYHWFTAWGRDTLIALPGITLVTGRENVAKKILYTIAGTQEKGLIPNRLGKDWKEFNSADASLLFFYAMYKYLTYTNDLDTVKDLWNTLETILNSYTKGVGEKIKMTDDGLLWVQGGMSWMDARVDGECVTPREGKPVEINALWYNALKIMSKIAGKLGKENNWGELADKVKKNFQDKFWNQEKNYLYDVIREDSTDDSLRPNQLFAISLPFPLLEEDKAKNVLSVVKDKLLTPYGIRSLDKDNPQYKPTYQGDITNKDLAYHQGTVWSWLLGPFVTGFLKFHKEESDVEFVKGLIEYLLEEHCEDAGLGYISEIFDGNEPHKPRGCVAQTWSVGEVLRCYIEDIKGNRPLFEIEYL